MSTRVILVFAFGTDLLRLRNVGSFRQKCSGRCTPHEVRRWHKPHAMLLCPSSRLTMSNSAVFFVPAARCCARVSLFLSRPPQRGVGGAPTGALVLLSRVRDATD